MRTPTKRGGRPKRELKPGERVPLGLRVTPEMKRRLDDASLKSGRSQSQEVEFRLELSFEREDLLADALKLAFGKEFAGLILLIGSSMHMAGTRAHWSWMVPAHGSDGVAEDWASDARAYDQAVKAAITVMEAARPLGDPSVPALDENDPQLSEMGKAQARKLNDVQRHMGAAAAQAMLGMVRGSTTGSSAWAMDVKTIQKLLGPIVDRLQEGEGETR